MWGGTSWKAMLCLLKDDLRRSEHSLSSMCKSGAWPLFLRRMKQSFHVSAMDLACLFLMGMENMEFES